MSKSTFSERLNFIIKERGIRQKDLCLQTGIGKSAMSQYLSGSFEPKQQKLHILAMALNVSEAWLMGYDVPRERRPAGSDTSLRIMEVVAPDNSMSEAHIPMGSVVTVVPLDSLCAADETSAADFTDGLIAADGKIICWSVSDAADSNSITQHGQTGSTAVTLSSSSETPEHLSYLHLGNGTLILTAADHALPPEVFTYSDLDNGRLVIHGVVQKVVINF